MKQGRASRQYHSAPVGRTPRPTSEAISRAMRSNKSSGTSPELVLARVLRKRLDRNSLPGHPDFVYRRARLAVFVHGCWWHGCPTHYRAPKVHAAFWRRKLERNRERDVLVKAELKRMGWKALEVWEHEIQEDSAAVAKTIRSVAAGTLPRPLGAERSRRRPLQTQQSTR